MEDFTLFPEVNECQRCYIKKKQVFNGLTKTPSLWEMKCKIEESYQA